MNWIEPGDYVECIHTASDGHVYIMKNRLYKVSTLMAGPANPHPCAAGWACTEPGLRLVEPNPMNPALWWCSMYFRPVYRPKEGAFDYMKARPHNYDTVLREIEEEAEKDARKQPPKACFRIEPIKFDQAWQFNFRLPPSI